MTMTKVLARTSRKDVIMRVAALMVAMVIIAANWQLRAAQQRGGFEALDFSADAQVTPMPFETAGDSFPGSAYYYLSRESDVPVQQRAGLLSSMFGREELAPGTHGDDEDPTLGGLTTPGPAARALAQVGTTIDRGRALECLTAAIYYEAASEPDDGQRAVAQVILNRVTHPSFPKTVCGVVYQGSERSTGCQFTFTCDGALARKPARYFWDRARKVADAALSGYVFKPVGLATHYHTFAVHPYWADSLNFIGQIGAHRFYRFTGPAGLQSAFHFAYAGAEPLASPHARTAIVAKDDAADPLALERAYEASLKPQTASVRSAGANASYAAPNYTNDVVHRGGDAAFRANNLPEANTVRDEYKNSGQWIGSPQ